jgi:predicted nucleotidyltransferase
MRLTQQQVSTIINTTQAVAGAHSDVWLYGSRLDDSRRGGDIDLLVTSDPPVNLRQRARIKIALEAKLNRPVDVMVLTAGAPVSPFTQIAMAGAVRLVAIDHLGPAA